MNAKKNLNNKKVFVAMSGGVDSTVAAYLLKKDGCDVIGVTMCFGIKTAASNKPSCCGAEGIETAQEAARLLDIPHYVLDFKGDMRKDIIRNFVTEYTSGRTPNPCVRCNQFLKFSTLFKKIRRLGGDYLATGHYAKIVYDAKSKEHKLKKGKDKTKDQSYFLYGIQRDILPHILFPVGHLTKSAVREIARQNRLTNAGRPASQDICFIPQKGYAQFIAEHAGKDVFKPGIFKDDQGRVVGEHKGIIHYTIGQRDGLGIALGRPVYVYRIDKKTNTIYVGGREKLYRRGLILKDVNFLKKKLNNAEIDINVKIRYNQQDVPARLIVQSAQKTRVEFKEPQKAVTPGQSAVFYQKDTVIGGGIIARSLS